MNHLADQHVLVLGLGASGLALARWCTRCGAQVTVADTRATPPQLDALRSTLPAVVFVHAALDAELFASTPFDLVLKSPGLSPAAIASVLNAAEARGIARGNELSLFARALAHLKHDRGYTPQVIAITGTNGKTTVTSLTGQLVLKAGKSVAVAGNIGPTLLDTLTEQLDAALQAAVDDAEAMEDVQRQEVAEVQGTPSSIPSVAMDQITSAATGVADDEAPLPSISAALSAELPAPLPSLPSLPTLPALPGMPQVWVLELSSFQLDGVSNFEPTVATVLNVTQDHLDWHGTFAQYAAAKSRIYGHGLMLLNRDDPLVMAALPVTPPSIKGKQVPPRPYLTFGHDEPRRPGDYGIETVNGMAWLVRAALADETVKRRKDEEVVLYIQRLMPVDALRIRGRHNACNALAATALAVAAGCSLAPMLHGLREYRGEPHRVESIAMIGGVEYFDDSKGTNVGATVAALNGLGAERKLVVILGGEGKGQDFVPLAAAVTRHARAVVLIGRDAPVIRLALQDALVRLLDAASLEDAVTIAAREARTGDAVILSPACASFDMFEDYQHRARVFCEAVQALGHEEGVAL